MSLKEREWAFPFEILSNCLLSCSTCLPIGCILLPVLGVSVIFLHLHTVPTTWEAETWCSPELRN